MQGIVLSWSFPFGEIYFGKIILSHKYPFSKKELQKKPIHQKLPRYEGCLRISTFIFWILPKLAKHTYGWLPLQQHHPNFF